MTETEAFFSTPEAVARLDLIRHLIENSELVPLVRGPSGSGKTLLASRLQSIAPNNWVVCHFDADASMQPEHLLAHIARCIGLPLSESNSLRRINERFELLRKQGSLPVLLVDDAQTLPPTSLITLLRLYERQIEGAPLVSLVLFANEDIDKLLATPQLQIMSPQAIQVIDLPLLTREEADAFMQFLFEREGLDERLLLDANKLSRLYRETGGVPGQLAAAILSSVGSVDASKVSTPEWLEKRVVIYRVLPVAAIVLILLLFQGPINRMFESGPDQTPAKVVEIDLPNEKTSPKVSVESGDKSSATEAASASAPQSALKYPKPASMEPPLALQVPPEEDAAQGKKSATDVASDQSVPSQPIEASLNFTVEGSGAQEEKPELALKEASQADKVEAPEPSTPEAGESQLAPEIPGPEEPRVEKTTAVAPAAVVDTGGEGLSLTDGRAWVASQPPGNYTLQLLAAGNLVSVQRFIKKHGLSGEVFTIQTQRKGKPWYPLLWGSFADRDAAKKASKRLPSAIQSGGYWARTFASLQN